MLVILIFMVCVVLCGGLGWLTARKVSRRLGLALGGLGLVITALLIMHARQLQGVEGLGHVIVAMLVTFPASVGWLTGCAFERLNRSRANSL